MDAGKLAEADGRVEAQETFSDCCRLLPTCSSKRASGLRFRHNEWHFPRYWEEFPNLCQIAFPGSCGDERFSYVNGQLGALWLVWVSCCPCLLWGVSVL